MNQGQACLPLVRGYGEEISGQPFLRFLRKVGISRSSEVL